MNSGYPKSVVVSSQGPAAKMYPQAMGVYRMTSITHSDRPMWRGREGSIVFNGNTISFNNLTEKSSKNLQKCFTSGELSSRDPMELLLFTMLMEKMMMLFLKMVGDLVMLKENVKMMIL